MSLLKHLFVPMRNVQVLRTLSVQILALLSHALYIARDRRNRTDCWDIPGSKPMMAKIPILKPPFVFLVPFRATA